VAEVTGLEPTPPSQEALEWLAAYGDPELADLILHMGDMVTRLVPSCVGLSVTFLADDLTFTLVASCSAVGRLDAMQYLTGGPCLDAVSTGHTLAVTRDDVVDEERWRLFALAEAATGIESSLTLPVMNEDQVIGSVNLYASTPDAFEDHVQEIADVCEAWAPGAVRNADLSFTTRLHAAATPARMEQRALVDTAIRFVAAVQDLDTPTAARRIRDAATRAGVTEPELARVIVDTAAQSDRVDAGDRGRTHARTHDG
jgi:transcriptional regulator with GAF, ATPase, and Fis domain